jgi:DNA-binding response OmpR family regulator/KaiC/GvpD/RAD55 family RecA-like ATPase
MDTMLRTGISLLDDHIGGLQKGKPYLLFGDAGTGKSLLGMQFLLRGAEAGEAGIYMSLERPADLLAQGQSLGLDLHPALERGEITFLEYDQDVTSRILRYGWKPFLEQLSALRSERSIRRFVFDPILPLVAGTTEEGRLRYDLRYLAETFEEWEWTSLFLNDRGATQGHPSLYRVLSEICSGVFELQDETENLASSKYLFIHKLRQSSDRMRKIPFTITPGVGLVEARGNGHVVGSGSAAPAPARRKVLIADDDPFIRSLLKKALREEFEVVMAGDGIEALTLTLRERPDLLVLDVMMPKLTGFEVTRSLRASRFHQPILLMSGLQDSNERVRGLSLGANDFIAKPFQIREMVERIRNASRFRMIDSADGDPIDLDALLHAARTRLLDPEEFLTQLEAACGNVQTFGVSLGIIRFALPGSDAAAIVKLGEAVEKLTRPEDLLAAMPSGEIVAVLNTETIDGTMAYLRKLRREWGGRGSSAPPEWREKLRVSFGAIDPSAQPIVDPREVIEAIGRPELQLLCDPRFESIPAIAPALTHLPATGTDA